MPSTHRLACCVAQFGVVPANWWLWICYRRVGVVAQLRGYYLRQC